VFKQPVSVPAGSVLQAVAYSESGAAPSGPRFALTLNHYAAK
jgi:hypothetical protein